jgi:hypothetical protein
MDHLGIDKFMVRDSASSPLFGASTGFGSGKPLLVADNCLVDTVANGPQANPGSEIFVGRL